MCQIPIDQKPISAGPPIESTIEKNVRNSVKTYNILALGNDGCGVDVQRMEKDNRLRD